MARPVARASLAIAAAAVFLTTLAPAPAAANEPPVTSISGPAFVPVSSLSPRQFDAGAYDNDSVSWTKTLECGDQPPIDSGPGLINGHYWFTCSFDTPGTHLVGVSAQDNDGEQSSAFMEVVATSRVQSVADAHLLTIGHTQDRPFGSALAFVDLNGDGKAELVVGDAGSRGSPEPLGVRQIHVLFGRSAGGTVDEDQYTGATGFVISGTADETDFGQTIADAGDVNGDGYHDLIIASPASGGDPGRAYVVFGGPNMGDLTPDTMTADQGFRITTTGAGSSVVVTAGGDVNGDGYADIVVGTPGARFGQILPPGAAFVIYGKAHPTDVDLASDPSTFGAELVGGTTQLGVGQAIAIGDVNGDKKADIVLPTGDVGGVVQIVFGKSNLGGVIDVGNMTGSEGFTVSQTGLGSGMSVAVGDMNGDGLAEVFVTGRHTFNPYDIRSRVTIIRGKYVETSLSLFSPPAGRTEEVLLPPGEVAGALAAGDWNGDKRADLVIGASGADDARGSAYVVPGQKTLTDVQLDVLGPWSRIDGDQLYARAGQALAVGDFNGDKHPDIAVGAPWQTTQDPDPFALGRVGVFLGTGANRADKTPPVAAPPSPSLISATYLASNPTVRITWPAATDNVGVAKYRLQKKVNGGAWRNVSLASPTTLLADVKLKPGRNRYTFRVRAVDGAGNASEWATGPTFKVHRPQEKNKAVSYSGSFTRVPLSGASGGYVTWSDTGGDTASFTFTGRAVAFVTTRGARGQLQISVDGERQEYVDLFDYGDSKGWIPVAYDLAPGTHTVVVQVLGTSSGASGNPRIDVDAFVVLK